MNLEQQYRTGRFQFVDALFERLTQAIEAAHQKIDGIAWRADWVRGHLALEANLADRRVSARRVLGIDGELPASLSAHTQSLVDANPELEAEYWHAMWALRETNRDWVMANAYLEMIEADREVQSRFEDAGWPVGWHHRYCSIWEEFGGSAATARSWASQGWEPVAALTCRIKLNGKNLSVADRVKEFATPTLSPSSVSAMTLNGGRR